MNLYEWDQPPSAPSATGTFIAQLDETEADGNPAAEGSGDEEDWSDFLGDLFPRTKRSRVSGDGGVLLFGSRRPLTGYENRNESRHPGPCISGGCSELFRYQAAGGPAGGVVCVSCNPDPVGETPQEYKLALGDALLNGAGNDVPTAAEEPRLSRNLSVNGSRVFFETPDALVSGDVNTGRAPECTPPASVGIAEGCDVYEWEAEGEGSCRSHAEDDGCLFLISSGTSSEQSYFGDASADGSDVFFFTRQALTPGDEDSLVDVYDAHECVSGEPCAETVKEPRAECLDEGCPSGYQPPGAPNVLSAGSGSGSGNLVEPVTGGTETPPGPSAAQKRAAALKKCHAKHNKHKRLACEARARKEFPVKAASKASAAKKAASRAPAAGRGVAGR
jgi:hypothetical protein